eukprot:746477-Hanusia_phi.AAC.2
MSDWSSLLTAAMKKVLSPNSDTMIIMSEEMKASAYPEIIWPPIEDFESVDVLVAFLPCWEHTSPYLTAGSKLCTSQLKQFIM